MVESFTYLLQPCRQTIVNNVHIDMGFLGLRKREKRKKP